MFSRPCIAIQMMDHYFESVVGANASLDWSVKSVDWSVKTNPCTLACFRDILERTGCWGCG